MGWSGGGSAIPGGSDKPHEQQTDKLQTTTDNCQTTSDKIQTTTDKIKTTTDNILIGSQRAPQFRNGIPCWPVHNVPHAVPTHMGELGAGNWAEDMWEVDIWVRETDTDTD